MSISYDFLIIGGGIIGTQVALNLKRRFPDCSVGLLEKESRPGLHGSGRNSGVIHAGFYYSADSLKAKFTRQGNVALTRFCEENSVPIRKCGKLVVAQTESEVPLLDELLRRGHRNDVPLEKISLEDARKIEPRVRTLGGALWSPTTSSIDPLQVLAKTIDTAQALGIRFHFDTKFLTTESEEGHTAVHTSTGKIECGYLVNAAGLYADKIALQFGFSEDYRIIPFKGLYLYSNQPATTLRTHIYPVPNLANPFLGVHFTLTIDGRVKIGPTAIPALWREQYAGLENFRMAEFFEIAWRDLSLFLSSEFDFRRLAREEWAKQSRKKMVELGARLVEGVRDEDFPSWGKPGIRAQLLDIRKKKLEMDFVVQGDGKSMHVLNAVSPAFTCSIPFAGYVGDKIESSFRR